MTDRELRKLRRSELLEIMLAQSREIDRQREKIEELEAQLKERRIRIEESGSVAEAALKITDIFTQAQKAADLYLEEIRHRAGAEPAAEGGTDAAE